MSTGERMAAELAEIVAGGKRFIDFYITGPEHFTTPIELADFIVGLIQQGNDIFGNDEMLTALRVAFSVADLGVAIDEAGENQDK